MSVKIIREHRYVVRPVFYTEHKETKRLYLIFDIMQQRYTRYQNFEIMIPDFVVKRDVGDFLHDRNMTATVSDSQIIAPELATYYLSLVVT